MRKIVVVDYDASWPAIFQSLKASVASAVGDLAIAIEHVGSTSVPSLAAKPVIDMDVVVASEKEIPEAIRRLSQLGYVHEGNLGVEGREAFSQPPELPAHHLYLCWSGSLGLKNHLAVRDFLRANPGAVATYGALKKTLADNCGGDIDAYIDGKTDFLVGILRESLPAADLERIDATNRKK